MALKEITTQNPEPPPKKSQTCEEKAYFRLQNPKIIKSNFQEFDNLFKENQNKANEVNIGSNKVVLEMIEDTTKYEVSRA